MLGKVFTAIRYTAMLGMYGGFTTVCVGACVMEAPKSVYPDGAPPVSPAVACTMNLCFQYFAVYLGIALIQTYQSFYGESTFSTKLQKTCVMCQNTVAFAPMLCILFIGARMRALQIDPVNGNPQKWAQTCFYLCAYAVLVQCLILLCVPFVGGELEKGETEGDVSFQLSDPTIMAVLTAVRYAVMLALYGGFTAVIYSVCVIKNPNGPTPAVSPAMQCVMNLTIQFFFVYLMLWVFVTAKQFTEGVGKDFLVIQVLMVLLLPAFTRGPPKTDEDGNVVADGTGILATVTVAIRYLAFLALYGGVITVVTALFLITPETATGTGALIPGVEVPVPP